MTDRELLELAAKAAEKRLWIDTCGRYWGNSQLWNPLTDDGDALRLAVQLEILVNPMGIQRYNHDPYAATRRAIVRAAAQIGREMG